jgi:hypothetical protein
MKTDLVSQRWRIMLKQTSKTTAYGEDMEQDLLAQTRFSC